DVHAHVAVEDRQTHFERSDEVALAPGMRPVFQSEVAERDGGVRRLLLRKRPRLQRAPGHQRVREIREFLRARGMTVGKRLDEAQPRWRRLRSGAKEREWGLRQHTLLAKNVGDKSGGAFMARLAVS